MIFLTLLKSHIRKSRLKRIRRYFTCEDGTTLTDSFNMRLDNPKSSKQYLQIGADCIIGGSFIFESSEGTITIGDHAYIGSSTFISRTSIIIGNNVTIAWGCTIYDHDSHSLDFRLRRKDIDDELRDIRAGVSFIKNKDWNCVNSKAITIRDDVWIGMNCIILKGVTIGEGAIVGAGSVVTKDVPAWTLVAGNPTRFIRQIPH